MGKTKYSPELRLKIAEEYLTGGLGIKLLAQKYYVNHGDIQKRADAYREHVLNGSRYNRKCYLKEDNDEIL